MDGAVSIGLEVLCADVFELMKNSEYMRSKGYEVGGYDTKFAQEEFKDVIKGIEITRHKKGDIIGYTLHYKHEKDWSYVHIRGLDKKEISEFTYLITLGDEEKIVEDLVGLAKEIQDKLGNG